MNCTSITHYYLRKAWPMIFIRWAYQHHLIDTPNSQQQVMEGETRRRVGTGTSEEDEENVKLVLHDVLDRPESPDSETTDEEAGRILIRGGNNNSHKKYTDTSSAQTASFKKPHWRIRYCNER